MYSLRPVGYRVTFGSADKAKLQESTPKEQKPQPTQPDKPDDELQKKLDKFGATERDDDFFLRSR